MNIFQLQLRTEKFDDDNNDSNNNNNNDNNNNYYYLCDQRTCNLMKH